MRAILKQQNVPFWVFLLLSATLHTFCIVYLLFAGENKREIPLQKLVFIQMPKNQVVDQKNFNHLQAQKPTSYLSHANKVVEKQIQAMMKGLFQQASIKPSSQVKKTAHSKKPKQTKKTSRSLSSLHSLDSQAFSQQLLEHISAPLQMDIAQDESFTSLALLSQTTDFLPGVQLGSHTLLNTKELTYYSYYSRIKNQLYVRWTRYLLQKKPQLFSRVSQYKKQLFSTHLYVLLSSTGELQDLRVTKSSGEEDIDSLAIHAFMASTPFPNPPKGLIAKDGHIHIQQSFHLYIRKFLSAFVRPASL